VPPNSNENATAAGVPIPAVMVEFISKAKRLVGRKTVRDLKREIERKKGDQ